MSSFPKTARHPNILLQVAKWRTLSKSIDVEDYSRLSDIPDLAIDARRVKKSEVIDYLKMAGEIVGANAIRALAKGYESLDALSQCDQEGVSVSATLHAYNASFFAARAFCMLMGFGPLDRDSPITVDVFSEGETARDSVRIFDSMELHKFKRWGHDEVWKLTKRLIDTAKVPDHLSETRDWLRHARLEDSAKFRNSVQYDDRKLAPIDEPEYIDFPDRVKRSIFDERAPPVLSHQFFVSKKLTRMCDEVLARADMSHLLRKCASDPRATRAFEFSCV